MGLLSDCHRRIEMFLGSLEQVAVVSDHLLSDDARRALESALRYFKEAAPRHTADEEESLFPRLRKAGGNEVLEVLSTVEVLETDHERAEALHAEADELGQRCLAAGYLEKQDAERFKAVQTELRKIYSEHIRIEDEIVFPAADRILTATQKAGVAAEMARRRDVKPVQLR